MFGTGIAMFAEPMITFASQPIKLFTWAPNTQSLVDLFAKISGYFLYAAGALAFIMLVIGGIRYIVSAGDDKQLEAAKKTITYAIIGLVICALSLLTVKVITNVLPLASEGISPKSPVKSQASTTNQQANLSWVEGMKSKVTTVGDTIKKCSYRGKDAYSIPVKTGSKDRDSFTRALYNEKGSRICYTEGGLSGKGDGKCNDFMSTSCGVIWTKPATTGSLDGWKEQYIQKDKPIRVEECSYKGGKGYFYTSDCCDQFNHFYSEKGTKLCSTGGFSGKGDGKCPILNIKSCKNIWVK